MIRNIFKTSAAVYIGAAASLVSLHNAHAAPPRDSLPLAAPDWPTNYRLHIEFADPGEGNVRFGNNMVVPLSKATDHDIALEYPKRGKPVLRVWSGGKLVRGPEKFNAAAQGDLTDFPEAKLNLGADFTAVATFESTADGTLFSKCSPQGKWSAGAKALFIRDGRLVYDIGWLGQLTGGPAVNDGKPHTAVLSVSGGVARLWLDGKMTGEKSGLTVPDAADFIFKVGRASPDFAGDFSQGKINGIRVWSRRSS